MRITVQATGETIDRGNSTEERNRARNLICRVVNPKNTKASSQRQREYKDARQADKIGSLAIAYGAAA